MKFLRAGIIVSLFCGPFLSAETTPLSVPLGEGAETTIACELTQAPRLAEVPVFATQKQADGAKGTYHYTLWIPTGYQAAPAKRWPCLFIMAAGGNASMGKMADYLKSNGFIVVMLVESKNGAWETIIGNFLAAHDDVIQRVRIAEGEKYATGQSGGARGSSVAAGLRAGFGGVVMQSAGAAFAGGGSYQIGGLRRHPQIRLAMTMGNADENKGETDRMAALFPKSRLAIFPFEGGHVWAPAPVFAQAMDWVRARPAQASAGAPASSGSTPSGKPGGSSFDDFFKKK